MLVCALLLAFTRTFPFANDDFLTCGAPQEGASLNVEAAFWPPGSTRCVVTQPGGQQTTFVNASWDVWLPIILFAAAVSVGVAAVFDRDGRLRLSLFTAVLLVGSLITTFIV